MAHEPGLLQAILDNPQDDTLRLVYADWLEEHGDPRGEFIRVQIQLAGMAPTDSSFRPLWNRELDLIRTYKEDWFGLMRKSFAYWESRRGFIDEVEASADKFLDHANELFGAHPVRQVRLTVQGQQWDKVAVCSYWPRVDSLLLSSRDRSASRDNTIRYVSGSASLAQIPLLKISNLYTRNGDVDVPPEMSFEVGKPLD